MRSNNRRRLEHALLSAAAALACAAGAQAADRPAAWVAGVERVRLPGDEPMGLASLNYLVEAAPGWWVGPALYGAATGHRGGLFTWGVEGQRQWKLGERVRLVGGLYVGGGGGAAAPVGGGLMLRPHADLLYDLGPVTLGLSASQVRFPSGDIRSNQLGLIVGANDRATLGDSSLFRPRRVLLSIGRYRATADHGSLGFVNLRAEQPLSPNFAATVEGGAAASGGADGYAEFLGGVVALWPAPDSALQAGVRVAAGLGGGGAVPTGGGTIAKAALLARLHLRAGWSVDVEAGRAHAFTGPFDSGYAAVSLATACCSKPGDYEWTVGMHHYLHAQRRDGSRHSLQTIGLEVRTWIDGPFYAVAQAHSAVRGGAGAYSAGLLGLGAGFALDRGVNWRAGAELMAGAAGGGGVSSQGGAVVQPMIWSDVAVGRSSWLRLAGGQIKSVRGELSTPVVELAWGVTLGR
jgi:hypothetical protein